jgi:hypothetical protein
MQEIMRPTQPIVVVCLTMALAGCGGVQWSKAGANDQAAASNDLTACNTVAAATMNRLYGPELPTVNLDPRFGPDMSRPPLTDRRLEEQQAVNRCMREKGYELVPAK